MDAELKPCPFCGGEAELRITDPDMPHGWQGVCCTNDRCPMSTGTMQFDAWNTRAVPPRTEVVITADDKEITTTEAHETIYDCPNCAESLVKETVNYCPNCGSAIVWQLSKDGE